MRLFIGTTDITDAPRLLQQGFRELGLEAEIGLMGMHPFYGGAESTVNVSTLHDSTHFTARTDGDVEVQVPPVFRDIAKKYDLFIFIASHSLLPRLRDLQALRLMGKEVVCYQTGSELRHEQTAVPFWNAYGHTFPQQAYPTHRSDAGDIPPWWKLNPFHHTFINKLYNTRMAERYASTICTHPSIFSLGIRPYMSIQLPMDARLCTFRIQRRTVPYVVHAPSKRSYKRTDLIFTALEELAEEGIPFRLQLLEGVNNINVLQTLSEADILIDQVGCGALGRLALEGFCSGCAVLSGNSAAVPWPPDRPALSATPATLKERLRELLTNAPLRLRLAAEGREYIEKGYHSPVGAAQAVLDALHREKNQDADYYPTVFTETATALAEEPVPPFLKAMTLSVLKSHGTHPSTDVIRLEREGMLPPGSTKEPIPRWDLHLMHKLGPWNWCARRIPPPTFDMGYTMPYSANESFATS